MDSQLDAQMEGKRVIITVLGHDQIGILAAVTGILAEARVNILDVSQTILQEFYTMAMVADTSRCTMNLKELRERLEKKGEELELKITVQHEDIFRFMHRI